MFDAYFVVGIALGVILTITLALIKWRSEAPNAKLPDGLAVFTSSYGLVASVKVFFITFDTSFTLDPLTRSYIAIGGIVTFWITLGAILTQFGIGKKKRPAKSKSRKR